MANPKKTEDGGHIIDVKRPGSATPSSTSKPVIVTNRPILKDPMVVVDDGSEAAKDKQLNNLTRKSLKPLEEVPAVETATTESAADEPKTDNQPAPTEPTSPETTITEPAEPENAEPAPPPQPIEEKTEPAEPTPADTEPPAKPAEADKPAETDGKPVNDAGTANAEAVAQAEADKEAAHQQEVQKLIDSKQYFLSINSVEKRRSRQVVLIGVILSLILVVAWADIALDAGIITIPGVKPLTHFFSN